MLHQRNGGKLELQILYKIVELYNAFQKTSFISRRTAQNLIKKPGHKLIKTDTNIGEFRFFNNNQNAGELHNPIGCRN